VRYGAVVSAAESDWRVRSRWRRKLALHHGMYAMQSISTRSPAAGSPAA
jgi:hypothetical protein